MAPDDHHVAAPQPSAPAPPNAVPAEAIFERFSRRLIGLARTRLDGRLRQKVDPEDVVQSAYKSFFLRYGEGGLAAEGWSGLWGLLTLITLRKCADRARYYRAECRDVAREAVAAQAGSEGDAEPWQQAVGREPTPEQAVALTEAVEGLLSALGEDERAVIEMSLQGYSTQEISERLGRAERSVRRLREKVRKHLERQSSSSSSGSSEGEGS